MGDVEAVGVLDVLGDGFGTAASAVLSGERISSRLAPISAHTTRLPANAMAATLREVGWLIITPVGT